MSKATPRPWTYNEGILDGPCSIMSVEKVGENRPPIAQCFDSPEDNSVANARHIIGCVNRNDRALDLLSRCENHLMFSSDNAALIQEIKLFLSEAK